MYTNLEFRNRYKGITSLDNYVLSRTLLNIIDKGFIKTNERFFLKYFITRENQITAKQYIDKTGHECFVNSIHINDYIDSDYLQYALLFTKEVFKSWDSLRNKKKLRSIISFEDIIGATVKFHVFRKNDIPLIDVTKLENCAINGVCVVDSDNCNI